MKDLIAADGTALTDDLVNQLADEAEAGFPNSVLTREVAPWRKVEPMTTKSVRVPTALWTLLEKQAKEEGISTSEYIRRSLAQGLLTSS